jgi:hypothetical protein
MYGLKPESCAKADDIAGTNKTSDNLGIEWNGTIDVSAVEIFFYGSNEKK